MATSKSAFLAMMSHELRTPLNAIAGYTDLTHMGIQGSVTPEQRSSLQRIRASQRHLLALIDKILLHATLEVGALPRGRQNCSRWCISSPKIRKHDGQRRPEPEIDP